MNIFLEEHLLILKLFNKYEVKYLLIGGYAVILHGYIRSTGDMDLWVEPSNENKLKIYKALSEVSFESDDLEYLLSINFREAIVFSIGSQPQKIDIITKVNLINFVDAYNQKIIYENEEIKIPLIHLNDLILSKFNTGRSKDKADVEILQEINHPNYK